MASPAHSPGERPPPASFPSSVQPALVSSALSTAPRSKRSPERTRPPRRHIQPETRDLPSIPLRYHRQANDACSAFPSTNLFRSFERQLNLTPRSFLRFLCEHTHNDDSTRGSRHISCAGDTVSTAKTHLPEWPFEMFDLRLVNIWQPNTLNQFRDTDKARPHVCWQAFQFRPDLFAEQLNGPVHCQVIPFLQYTQRSFADAREE